MCLYMFVFFVSLCLCALCIYCFSGCPNAAVLTHDRNRYELGRSKTMYIYKYKISIHQFFFSRLAVYRLKCVKRLKSHIILYFAFSAQQRQFLLLRSKPWKCYLYRVSRVNTVCPNRHFHLENRLSICSECQKHSIRLD